MVPAPAAAVSVPPVHVVAALDGVATITPAGSVSVKSTAVAATPLPVLSSVKLSVVVETATIESGENAFVNVGDVSTVRLSLAVPLLPPDEVRSPVVFTCVPGVVLVTSTCTVQTASADSPPPP